jgi:hypothetical protein
MSYFVTPARLNVSLSTTLFLCRYVEYMETTNKAEASIMGKTPNWKVRYPVFSPQNCYRPEAAATFCITIYAGLLVSIVASFRCADAKSSWCSRCWRFVERLSYRWTRTCTTMGSGTLQSAPRCQAPPPSHRATTPGYSEGGPVIHWKNKNSIREQEFYLVEMLEILNF